MHLFIRLLALIAVLSLAAYPARAGDDPAILAARAYVEALLGQDYDTAVDLLCTPDRDILDEAALRARFEQIGALDFTADGSDLEYSIGRAGDDWAQVHLAGEVQVTVDGVDEPVILTPVDLRIGTLWPVVEADAWKVCSHPPAHALPDLDADVIAWVFLDAAFGGDYDTAHAVMCQDRANAFSESQYEAAFQDFLTGRTQIALDGTIFEITAQDEVEATVTLKGTIVLTLAERRDPVTMPAERLGWGPVHLVYEDGWKICPEQPFES